MLTLPLSKIASVLNASPINSLAECWGVSIDTRSIQPHNLFIAIKGDQFDSHDFLDIALEKGACAAIVSRATPSAIPQIIVPDTLTALGQLASYWRQQFSIPFIAVTGSNGKTTVKNMIASILQAASPHPETVLVTEGNLNNHIGLPLTLLRLSPSHTFAVVEMGMNHFGEIAYLSGLAQPTIAVINNAGAAHLEGVSDLAGVARAKGEIFTGLSPTGKAILNNDDPYFGYWKELAGKRLCVRFGFNPDTDVTAMRQENGSIDLHTPIGKMNLTLPLTGKHNILNALAATAAGLAVNIDLNIIKLGLEQIKPTQGRLQELMLSNGAHLINDTYNANPSSLHAAVETLAALPANRKIVVLGDMKELGSEAVEQHTLCGKMIRQFGIDYLFTLGDLSASASQAFGSNAQHFTDYKSLVSALLPHLTSNTTVLVKGSRGMRMERIVAELAPDAAHFVTH